MLSFEDVKKLAQESNLAITGERTCAIETPGELAGIPSEFDLLVVHGNISWWGPADRERLWALLRTPSAGSIYISFDAYPGARARDIIRDIAQEHEPDGSLDNLADLFGFFEFLCSDGQHPDFRAYMEAQRQRLLSMDPAEALHELYGDWRPFDFAEIEEIAAANGRAVLLPPCSMATVQWAILHPKNAASAGTTQQPGAEEKVDRDYQKVPYPDYLHHRASPDATSSMAYVFGLDPVNIRHCRVLEIGCGNGLSLRTWATAEPGSEFVGIDLSRQAIDRAKQGAEAAGIRNVRFEAMDIMDFKREDFGEFDYIIAHGVYSWVPDAVRIRTLEIYEQCLSERGIGFISFNARPGYHIHMALRSGGMYAARNEEGVAERSETAIRWLQQSGFEQAMPEMKPLMQTRLDNILAGPPVQSGFDEFGSINNPFLFSRYAADIDSCGLRYVCESQIWEWTGRTFSQSAQSVLDRLSQMPVRRMVYRDLIRFCIFHATIVCRKSQKPSPTPVYSRLAEMLLTTRAVPSSSDRDIRGTKPERYESPSEAQVDIATPLIKAFLLVLQMEAPGRLSLREALDRASLMVSPEDAKARDMVTSWLPAFWETGFVDVCCFPLGAAAPTPGTHPETLPAAREQSIYSNYVPSLIGTRIHLESNREVELLRLMDGTRTLARIRELTGYSEVELNRIVHNWARVGLFVA